MPRSPVKALKAFLRAKMCALEMRKVSRMVVASNFMRQTLKTHGVLDSKITVLPYFIPWNHNPWSEPGQRKGVLFVGRIVQAKGVFVLLRVLSRLPDVTLDIVGDGPDRKAVEQSIKEMDLEERVVCHGWVSDEDTLRGFYTRNDVAIVPSIWPEPFAIVGLEAGMCRRPSVAFDVGGISDWLQHGRTGYLVEEGNSEELERTLNRILSDRKKLREMGEAAAEHVGATFSVETHMEQLQQIFDALASE